MRILSSTLLSPILLLSLLAAPTHAQWIPGSCASTDLAVASECCLDHAQDANERNACFQQDFVDQAPEFTILGFAVDPQTAACGDETCAVGILGGGVVVVQCLDGAQLLGSYITGADGNSTGGQLAMAHLGGDVYRLVFRDVDLNISSQDFDCVTQQAGSLWKVAPDGPNRFLPSINETTHGNVVIANVNGTTDEIEERLFDGAGNQIGLARLTPLLGLFADKSKSVVFNDNTDFPVGVHVVEDLVLGTITLGFGDFSPGNVVQLEGRLLSLEPIGDPNFSTLVGVTFTGPSGTKQRFYDIDGSFVFEQNIPEPLAEDSGGTGISNSTLPKGFATFFGVNLIDGDPFLRTQEIGPGSAVENNLAAEVFSNATAGTSLAAADGSLLLVASVTTAEGGSIVGRYYPSVPEPSVAPSLLIGVLVLARMSTPRRNGSRREREAAPRAPRGNGSGGAGRWRSGGA